MGTPIKIKELFTSDNLKEDYKEYLLEVLPILKHEGLLDLVIDYCNELKFCEMASKESYIRNNVLNKILEKLKKLRKEAIKISNLKENNSTYIKEIEEINVNGLIQTIILCTVKYYLEKNTDKSLKNNIAISLKNLNINQDKIYIRMNKVYGKNLTEYILNLYNSNEKSTEDKNNEFIYLSEFGSMFISKSYFLSCNSVL
jgi:hypothetical protein